MAELNYFNCTLGEAAGLPTKNKAPWRTIPELLDYQAQKNGERTALAFPCDTGDSIDQWKGRVYTFERLRIASKLIASLLSQRLHNYEGPVAILAASTIDFLDLWLGFAHLDRPVLLIAPEVPIVGIANLLQGTRALRLFHDDRYSSMATEVLELLSATHADEYKAIRFPVREGPIAHPDALSLGSPTPDSIAYIHHTSGTSSGLPKPIPITHRGAVGVLPSFFDPRATFTTTPLYHGGPADCFRAWAAGAAVWLFPGERDMPITANNILTAINLSKSDTTLPRIHFFTAVPYILEILADTEEGLKMLKSMELVGTGGASLSQKTGDNLVQEHGIRLLSRYGSAECGFILCSRRDFATEHDWRYLRSYESSSLRFSNLEDGLVELILTKDWPFLAKINTDEGGYSTSDVFEPHSSKMGLWAYHSRNDAQIALSTGKKFDPSPMEEALKDALKGLNFIRDVYVFGAGRPHPGILLLPSHKAPADKEIAKQILPFVEDFNLQVANHARIKKHMIIVTAKDSPPLHKSSKGTVIRRQVEETYQQSIEGAYGRQSVNQDEHKAFDINDVNLNIRCIVKDAFSGAAVDQISDEEDLYRLGADSMMCMEIRERIQQDYGQVLDYDFPLTIAYDCGSIEALVKHIVDLYKGASTEADNGFKQMEELAEKMGRQRWEQKTNAGRRWQEPNGERETTPASETERDVVVLTGATGTLGVWILHLLRLSSRVCEIHCLVRGATEHAARERLSKALRSKNLPSIEDSKTSIHIHTCKLSEASLGLSPDIYQSLAQKATLIIHSAWAVNFNLPLKAFADDLRSLNNLLSLCASTSKSQPPYFLFCSSVASVLGPAVKNPIQESIYPGPMAASSVGYARSKWVAEQICQSAHRYESRLHGRIAVLRIGQLCGDGQAGVWNVTEAWPLMLSSTAVTGALPRLKETLNWLKVDIAAAAVVEVAMNVADQTPEIGAKVDDVRVYHVINSQNEPTWDNLLAWVKTRRPDIEVLPPAEWVTRLEDLEGAGRDHPARKLLGLWKAAYCGPTSTDENVDPSFSMERTLEVAPVLAGVQPLNEDYFGKIWAWIEREMS